MKREILFRGLSFSGEWVYGCLIQYENSSQIGVLKYADVMDFVKVRPETVGEFTGLTDRNGKRIFENQINKNNEIVCIYKNFMYLCNILNGDINLNFTNYEYKTDFDKVSENEKRVINEYIQQAERTLENKRISISNI